MSEQTPFDSGLRLLVQSMLGGVHTAFPGIVQSYDAATMRATVQPCLMRKYHQDPAAVPLPVLQDVPVLFMSTGSLHIIAPPDPGSYVLVICCERSLDQWLTSGGIVDPASPRKFDLSDAFAIPGLFPLPSAAPIVATAPATGTLEIRNSAGTCVFSMSQTEIGLQCGAAIPAVDYAVKFDQLKIAFDSLSATVRDHVHAFTGTVIPAPTNTCSGTTTPTPTPPTANMSLAKVANVRLP